MEMGRKMFLDAEEQRQASLLLRRSLARGLRRFREVAFLAVVVEGHASAYRLG
jgi:hypothetical protein